MNDDSKTQTEVKVGTSRAYLVGNASLWFSGATPRPLESELTGDTICDRNGGGLDSAMVFAVGWRLSGIYWTAELWPLWLLARRLGARATSSSSTCCPSTSICSVFIRMFALDEPVSG